MRVRRAAEVIARAETRADSKTIASDTAIQIVFDFKSPTTSVSRAETRAESVEFDTSQISFTDCSSTERFALICEMSAPFPCQSLTTDILNSPSAELSFVMSETIATDLSGGHIVHALRSSDVDSRAYSEITAAADESSFICVRSAFAEYFFISAEKSNIAAYNFGRSDAETSVKTWMSMRESTKRPLWIAVYEAISGTMSPIGFCENASSAGFARIVPIRRFFFNAASATFGDVLTMMSMFFFSKAASPLPPVEETNAECARTESEASIRVPYDCCDADLISPIQCT